ncbi:MAG: HAMP domain-containing histidine kinase [Clostridiales bacterium]|jgi:signal transduction histidine kinase|nr:HAMP domain-containing histidine kinase [Clostridiales bacterium]
MQLLNTENNSNDGIIIVDKELKVIAYNSLILNQKEVKVGESLNFINAEEKVVYTKTIVEKAANTCKLTFSKMYISLSVYPIECGTRDISFVGIYRDITKEVFTEQARKDYIANISHELRVPLTAIRGLIEPIREGLVKDEATKKKYYDILLNETFRASRLITDLLELSNLESGSISVQCGIIELYPVVESVVSGFNINTPKNIKFEKDIEDIKEITVFSNGDRIAQVLTILLDNAFKFTKEGFVKITVKPAGKEFVELTVSDSGIGILETDLAHIFERFYISNSPEILKKSTGLGLSIAKEILDKLNITIKVESELGKGSKFVLNIPRNHF